MDKYENTGKLMLDVLSSYHFNPIAPAMEEFYSYTDTLALIDFDIASNTVDHISKAMQGMLGTMGTDAAS